MTYLDHAATTPMHPAVIDEMSKVMAETFGNPSSIHQYGRNGQAKLENARQVIADSLQVKPHEIIFNSGGTESDNTALIETALSKQKQGKHIITTAVEHPAVLNTAKYLEKIGFEVTYLAVDENGQLSVDEVKKALRDDTILVSIMMANNETGNLFPIAEVGELLKDHPAVFHTDAVQAYGKIAVHPNELQVDLLSVSAHKFNGPKGVGFLYKRDDVSLPVFLHGGEQEEKRRAGTQNLAAICGMAKAIECLSPEVQKSNQEKYQAFSTQLLNALTAAGIEYHVNGDIENKLSHVLNLQFAGISNDLMLMHLDLKGFAISTGSACTAGNVEPSHVLEAMYGKKSPAIGESVRISFGYGNTEDEVDRFAQTIIDTVERLKRNTRKTG
ncbi:cysteine desulfurase family protein [Tetragenococcus halophilus]|uniref:cysteine desulfurase n=1 Tax=Tetragenococcus halophilus subsp. halophilus TaxID=1513897 RepID=A0A2H6CS50_TETHA|nr:cysteine desulfurase family protein [Tetragenococcus halophilus]AOF49605.1 cysteine desulfurase [Tetragenococcus halophilus]MCO7026846.1 cysteine desulfurase [Tetragenococcus halophilus]MCO8293710.1 cysteine desulfurase [Tetragenococcus halophilus]GBD67794.1 cysteine desulfurase [Tetragenococcus halophilus subsp. halophilus]GBD72834.1 cysteine desulfurase [Tetragenococcus halophilus subsp. halophilus]